MELDQLRLENYQLHETLKTATSSNTSSRNTGQIAEVFVNAVQSSQQQKTVAHTKQSAPLKDDGSPRPPLQAARKLLPTASSTPQPPARLMKPEIFEKQSYGMIQPMLPLNHVTLLHGRSKSRPLTQRLLHPACVCVRAYVCQCAVAVPNRSLCLSLSFLSGVVSGFVSHDIRAKQIMEKWKVRWDELNCGP